MKNSAVATGLEKVSFHSNPKEKQCQRMFKLVLENAGEPEIKLPTSVESSKKRESSRKTFISASLTMPKPLLWITTNRGNFLKIWEYQTTYLPLRNLYAGQEAAVRTGHGITD